MTRETGHITIRVFQNGTFDAQVTALSKLVSVSVMLRTAVKMLAMAGISDEEIQKIVGNSASIEMIREARRQGHE